MMKKEYRVKDNKEFQYIFQNGKSFANRQLVIYFTEEVDQDHFRIGLSVGKKIGNAVTRNRIKRYLRQSFHEMEGRIIPTLNIIIIARQPTKEKNYIKIKQSRINIMST